MDIIHVHIVDDTYKLIRVAHNCTASQLCEQLCDTLDLTINRLNFGLFLGQRILQDDEAVVQTQQQNKFERLVFKQAYFTSSLRDLENDEALRSLSFLQAHQIMLNPPTQVDTDTLVYLGSIWLQHHFGLCRERKCFIDQSVLQQVIPGGDLLVQILWNSYQKMEEFSVETLELNYLEQFLKLSFSNCNIFEAKYNMKGNQKVNMVVKILINREQIQIVNEGHKSSFSYKQIKSWSHGEDYFGFKTADGAMHQFQCLDGETICQLLKGYILRILATNMAE
ncbi:PH-like_domain superfamily [Hexamita inflata]|uniref:PH-like_domain superfamily n=1 Tax=Hexamita inflata TaxID=28002 RepID=A0ABP1HW94_9EUKA